MNYLRVLSYVLKFLFKSLKNIDWEQFIMNTLANNFVLHMRIFKRAKEKMKLNNSMNKNQNKASVNENIALVEMFFDLEAELEKGICHDEVAFNSNNRELGTNSFK